jgi:hypothetical protein
MYWLFVGLFNKYHLSNGLFVGEIMEASSLLLIASLGSIAVLLMLYAYIYTFERKHFMVLWFAGWSIIAFNFSLDAFVPNLLRHNEPIFFLSLSSFFCANLLISWGTLLFLKT